MKTKLTGGRYLESKTINSVPVYLCYQSSGKLDNAILDFTETAFDIGTALSVYDMDECNCYPYVVICDEVGVQSKLNQLKLISPNLFEVFPTTTDLPTLQRMMLLNSITKGKSKGMGSRKSGELDNTLISFIKTIPTNHLNVKIFKPNETGTTNEDIRIVVDDKIIFRQENKRISVMCNITERFAMVGGKATLNSGALYDAFVSFVGFDLSFIDLIQTKSKFHIASTYIEFNRVEQERMKMGDLSVYDEVFVYHPVDMDDPAKGLYKGITVREYYTGILNKGDL